MNSVYCVDCDSELSKIVHHRISQFISQRPVFFSFSADNLIGRTVVGVRLRFTVNTVIYNTLDSCSASCVHQCSFYCTSHLFFQF